jgi:DNA polymerase-3 subunit delta
MDALQFLGSTAKAKRQPVYALVGDEDFLKRRARDAIIAIALGDADPAFAVATYNGDRLDFSTVRNDLETLPFLSPCRVVVVDVADKFVTENRPDLEKYVTKPSAAGVLVLDVKTFPETTKLAKALPDSAKIVCKAPYLDKLAGWCVSWTKTTHAKAITRDGAEMLVQLVGTAMGLLDQELSKLAVAVGSKATIEAEDVDRLVGRSRNANVFAIMDAVGNGQPARAIAILEELFAEGEDPMAVMGPLTWQLRQLATVGRHINGGESLPSALDAANVPRFRRDGYEKQVKWLGRRRLDKLTQWLVELNFGLKGGNQLPPQVQVERLIVKLARPREG